MFPVVGTAIGLPGSVNGKSKRAIVSLVGERVSCVFEVCEVVFWASSALVGVADITGSLFSSGPPASEITPRGNGSSQFSSVLGCGVLG